MAETREPRTSAWIPRAGSEPRAPSSSGGIAHEDRLRLRRLRDVVRAARGSGVQRLPEEDLAALPRLYRHACSILAELETRGERGRTVLELRILVGQAHALLHRDLEPRREHVLFRALRFLLVESPRAIRAEWKLVGFFFVAFYGVAAASWFGVSRDLELAYSLFQPGQVDAEIAQLRATPADEPFVGNFTFGIGESPQTAGFLILHNVFVGVLFFTSGLIAPFYLVLLGTNARMLGVYTGVAWHWGQAGAISSVLWCHGVLEIQAFLLAGIAGLVLLRAWIAPGAWTRREAMARESRRAWRLMAPLFPMLVAAGSIEAFVSPHAPREVRLAVAAGTGLLLVLWVALGGRRPDPVPAPADAGAAARG